MAKIIINTAEVEWTKITYHFQKIPNPGGGTYRVEVDHGDISTIAYIEQMVGKKLDDPDFKDAAKKHYASTYNLVQYVIWKLEESSGQKSETPLWVLNNIQDVKSTNDKLVISGECSPFLNDFESGKRL